MGQPELAGTDAWCAEAVISKPDLVEIQRPDSLFGVPTLLTMDEYHRWCEQNPEQRATWSQRMVLRCQCCGALEAKLLECNVVRCERHVGRNPCIVEDCGRTWPTRDYAVRMVCGKHWRIAPKHMRDVESRIRREARKRGQWTLRLLRRHERVWNRCIRAIDAALAGDVDMREIERLMGWDRD